MKNRINNIMTNTTTSIVSIAVLTALGLAASNAYAEEANNAASKKVEKDIEHIQIISRKDELNKEAGSVTLLDEVALEKFEYDDIHRILANVPGVNIRQEDGYGLRPNIGFRGVTPERSKKINILEDGVLSGPAPYSAPAAYYFPSMSRMTSVEVVKGPGAIKYGPNTVAGTLNLTTRAIPELATGQIEVAAGSNGYGKLHGHYGSTTELKDGRLGFVGEVLRQQADGFKDIDNAQQSLFDDDSGFVKNDVMLKVGYANTLNLFGDLVEQSFEMKVSHSNEDSNETYLGLTDADFTANPYRRYAITQAANMDWEHDQVQFTHQLTASKFSLTTRLYNNEFTRAWRKVNSFAQTGNNATDRTLQEILANPNEGINQEFYQVITGQKDSEALYEQLVVGTNDRSYYSRGIQSDVKFSTAIAGTPNLLNVGVRFHQDRIDRDHFEQNYLMTSGVLSPDQLGPKFTTVNYEETDALSLHFADTLTFGALDVTLGGRAELTESRYQNEVAGAEQDWLEKQTDVFLYSASAFYTLNDNMGLFAGVHEGFVPTSPKQAPEIEPEQSVNYELGYRYNDQQTQFETVLFFNDFDNLKESCSFSTSASCTNTARVDQEYNGGEVDVKGLELNLQRREYVSDHFDLPWSITYTRTDSEFKNSFESTFELWGDVTAGDPVPYLPEQQLTVNLGLAGTNWQVNLLVKYIDEMQEAAGENVALSGKTTDAYTVVDLSASYELGQWGSVYAKVDNLTDKVALVSRRPFGARPSKPRQVFVGYKYDF